MPELLPSFDTVFCAAIDIASAPERAAYIAQACGDDAPLRAQVEKLVAAHFRAGHFLESPELQLQGTVDQPVSSAHPGAVIGPYKLLEQIGEGGMGTVWMTQQTEPVKRLVALKLIKAGMDSKQVIARFEAERQALALMDHANIAKVLDAGATENGRPYFVMDLVKGVSITRYCDEHHLTPRQRLNLFIPICQAVQHAHQKGIIHRDLKPSNVLVALCDGKPVPKVIDFGVAKATGQPLTDKTLVTGFGNIVGTLEYMSPEQAEINQLDIDTRSDIYSLGVLLYELLAGSTPFSRKGLEKAGMLEMLRVIREQEPSKPSTKLSTAEGLPTLAANRGTEPAKLTKLVRGELDWIVMKALEKDRSRRYESANGFAMDVQRYLADEPVLACPPSVGYRLRKFARRNRGVLTAATMIMALLMLAVAGLTVANHEIHEALTAKSNALVEKTDALTEKKRAFDELDLAKNDTEKANHDLHDALTALTKEQQQTKLALDQERLTNYIHRIALAQREWWASNVAHTKTLLAECPTELRNWEWHYLERLCHGALFSYRADARYVAAVAYSPDGQRLTWGNTDGVITILDARTHKKLREFGAKGRVHDLAFAPIGGRLASAHHTGEIHLWDAETGEKALSIAAHDGGGVMYLAFHPDGTRLATVAMDVAAKVWDAQSGKLVFTLPAARGAGGRGIAYSSDGQLLAVGTGGQVIVWDANTGKELRRLGESKHAFGAVAISPNSKSLAAGGLELAKVWDLPSGQELWTLPKHGLTRRVAFSPNGQLLATLATSRAVHLWDASTGEPRLALRGHTGAPVSLAFNPVGQRLASGDSTGVLKIWDSSRQGEALELAATPTRQVARISFGAKCNRVAAVDHYYFVYVWDAVTGTRRFCQKTFGRVVALSPDGNYVTTSGEGQTLQTWEVDSARKVQSFMGHVNAMFVVYSHDGTRLASCSRDGSVKVWEAATGRELFTLAGESPVLCAAFSPEGRRLATGDGSGAVKIWDADTGKELRVLRGHKQTVLDVAFNSSGDRLASASVDTTVKIWDIATGRVLHTLVTAFGSNQGVAFHPDGTRLAVAVHDGSAVLWDTVNGREALTLQAHNHHCSGIAFSPDGTRLATGGYDGLVKIWNGTPWAPSTAKSTPVVSQVKYAQSTK